MATLAEIRARLKEQEDKKTGNFKSNSGPSDIFPHWNAPEGSTTRIRFLPDGDSSNNFFWVEKLVIKLPFAGIKGQSDKPTLVVVPCIEMWPDMGTCPILAEVRPWYKDETLKDLASKYWKKKSHIFQGFVRESTLKEDSVPENPIRRFIITTQLFNPIKSALMDPELENIPTDYDNGLDFIISKTSKGGFADYSTSKWARRESALTDAERAAIEQYGLLSLKESLPKRPSAEELIAIKEMFHASVDGEPYDPARWSQFYKPFDVANNNHSDEVIASAKSVSPTVKSSAPATETPKVDEPVSTPGTSATPAAGGGASRAEEILNLIRNRPKVA
jgi:hypothetical protein